MKLFFLAADLDTSDEAGQLALLACALPLGRFAVSVGVLGPATGGVADALSAAGITVASVPVGGAFSFSGAGRLRRAIREANPALVHAFGAVAARAARRVVANVYTGNYPRLIVSAGAAPGGGISGWLAARAV